MNWKTPKKLLDKDYVEHELNIYNHKKTTKLIKKTINAIEKQIGNLGYENQEYQPYQDGGMYLLQYKMSSFYQCPLIEEFCEIYCDIRIDFRDLERDTEPSVYIYIVLLKDEYDENHRQKWLFDEQWFVADFDIKSEEFSELRLEHV